MPLEPDAAARCTRPRRPSCISGNGLEPLTAHLAEQAHAHERVVGAEADRLARRRARRPRRPRRRRRHAPRRRGRARRRVCRGRWRQRRAQAAWPRARRPISQCRGINAAKQWYPSKWQLARTGAPVGGQRSALSWQRVASSSGLGLHRTRRLCRVHKHASRFAGALELHWVG
jgi:hypothetical protein